MKSLSFTSSHKFRGMQLLVTLVSIFSLAGVLSALSSLLITHTRISVCSSVPWQFFEKLVFNDIKLDRDVPIS